MSSFLEISQLGKTYPTPKGEAVIVENFTLSVRKGEFIALIGHSGCGKSTVLSMLAGLTDVTSGGVILANKEVTGAGPDRGVVFQSPCLLPWLTAFENVMLGVDQVFYTAEREERRQIAEYFLTVVGLADAMHKKPAELSQGMRQRGGIARAFALAPKMLLLDEPFGMLDSLTRFELQDVLLDLWQKDQKTAIIVTHDVDEALYLADRVVMMTNGPAATVGEILEVKFPRPRSRKQLLEDPEYYRLREQLIGFLEERSHVRPAVSNDPPRLPPARPASGRSSLNRFLSAVTPLELSSRSPNCTMKHLLRLFIFVPLLAATIQLARAQYTPPPPARPFPGFVNERLRAADVYMSAWDIGVNVRVRQEDKDDAGFTDAGSNWDFSKRPVDDNNNHYLLTRVMPRVGYTGKWFNALVEGRSSYSIADERYAGAAPGKGLAERDGPLDVHQAFVFVGNHKEFPVSLKIGRQELVYGDQRLIGHLRWNNNARTFDAAKVRWQNALFGVDVFTGGLVYNDHRNLNKSNSQDVFSGAYFNFPTVATKEIVEAYVLRRTVSRGITTDNWSGIPAPFRFPAPQDLYTAGVRIRSKPLAYQAWDYGVELMHQFGDRTAVFPAATPAAAALAPRLDQDAWAAVLQGGYTWTEHAWQPRLGVLYSYASGDKSSGDSSSETFQNLFATTHLHYGYMDLNSLQNLQDFRVVYTVKPRPNISIALEGHLQWLDQTTDFWYNVAGVPRNFAGAAVGSGGGYRINPSYSRSLGTEIDLVAGWTFKPYAQIEVGVSHYFRGDYIKQSLASVGSKDASYVYTQLTLNF